MATEAAKAYLESKNVKGYPEKALKIIGQQVLEFEAADADKSGALDRDEVKKMLEGKDHYGFATDTDVDKFLNNLDDDKNGKIDKDEFLQKIILEWANATYIRQLIKFDEEKNGMITKDQLYEGLTDDGYTKECLEAFLKKNGLDKGGDVEYRVFIKEFFDVNRKTAQELARAYLAAKNVKGYPAKALKIIGEQLLEFQAGDKDRSGTLERDEIKKLLETADHYGFASEADVENFLKELDDDGNGKVDKDEFLQKIVLSWANGTYIRQLIKFDKEKNGLITKEQLFEGLTDDGYKQECLQQFITKFGLEKDGKVDYKKFLKEFFDVNRKTAQELGKTYLETKNVKGYPVKAVTVIGLQLLDFQAADKDESRVLERDEIKKIVEGEDHYGFASEKDVDDFMKDLDDDGNGKVDRDEFMQKLIQQWANATYIRQLIKFDEEKNGLITKDQLYQGLTDDGYDIDVIGNFVRDNGLEKDGKVDYKVFLKQFFDVNKK